MNWLTDYTAELDEVFAETEQRIASLPAPFDDMGTAYLNAFHPLRRNSTKNYICYLLPYWLNRSSSISGNDSACRRMAVANVIVMLYFFIQDDLMDAPPPEWKERLVLANLLHAILVELYVPLFPASSPFWSYYRQYVTEWAFGVTTEHTGDDWIDRPICIAHKASPVKLASSGFMLLSGCDESIPAVSAMIDQVLITLQMADDLADWRDDVRQGNANCLLSMIRNEQEGFGKRELTDREVKAALYLRGSLNRYAAIAVERHGRLLRTGPRIEHLLAFHEFLTNGLLETAETIERDKSRLLMGGFSYFMSNYAK